MPNSSDPVPEKVHIRGLDDLTTKDIMTFASKCFEAQAPSRIEWIDDTSANIVYESAEIAQQALFSFTILDAASVLQVPALHIIPAKPLDLHPSSNLKVRLAVAGDRKLAGARDRSRFYLFNPEHDPGERRRRGGHGGGNRYRDRDDGGYRSQRYDDREQQKRQDGDADAGFDASIYDDDESALAKRSARNRPRDYSPDSEPRARNRGRSQGLSSKELFPDRDGEKGRLRDRSASPMRENEWESRKDDVRLLERKRDMAAAANREKAQLIKSKLKDASAAKELFPNKVNTKQRRPDTFDAADETADLFSDRMPTVPFTDDRHNERLTLASRVTNRHSTPNDSSGFSIRGAAKVSKPQSFSIKGAAGNVKELFPSTLGDNSGKELFSGRLEGRGQRRQKAEDLFH